MSYEVPGEAVVDLPIDKAKSWAFTIDDVDAHQSDLNLMSIFADSASEQLKVTVDADVLNTMIGDAHADNKGQTAGAISGNIDLGAGDADANIEDIDNAGTNASPTEFILRMGQALDEQNAPETGRWVVIPAAMAAMLKGDIIREANTMGDSQSILRNGKIGMIDRFTVYVSNNLPTVTPSAETGTYIYAGVPSACAFASQIVKNETLPNPDSFGELMRGLQVYGYKTIKPEGLVEGVVKIGTV